MANRFDHVQAGRANGGIQARDQTDAEADEKAVAEPLNGNAGDGREGDLVDDGSAGQTENATKDPKNPRFMGELKIPGFSTYIHPLDENHLLTIGFDGSEDSLNGQAQVAIFDISNFSKPTQLHKLTLKTRFFNALQAVL